jgi:hypothetical protein
MLVRLGQEHQDLVEHQDQVERLQDLPDLAEVQDQAEHQGLVEVLDRQVEVEHQEVWVPWEVQDLLDQWKCRIKWNIRI